MSGSRNWLLSGILLAVATLVAYRMLPPRVAPVLMLEITRNVVPIQHLDQPRSPLARKIVHVDVLDLARDGRFAHPRLGDIGYGEHFFVDLDLSFEVVAGGDYRFVVASDDGFELRIDDDQPLCGFATVRELVTQTCPVRLARGEHRLRLRYFQADGEAGLSVRYNRQGERRMHWLGQDSRHIRFRR